MMRCRWSRIRSRLRRIAYRLDAKRRWSIAIVKPTARPVISFA
jgi:hypothetical protein